MASSENYAFTCVGCAQQKWGYKRQVFCEACKAAKLGLQNLPKHEPGPYLNRGSGLFPVPPVEVIEVADVLMIRTWERDGTGHPVSARQVAEVAAERILELYERLRASDLLRDQENVLGGTEVLPTIPR